MGKLLAFLGGPLGTYALIAVGVVMLGMAGTIAIQSARIDAEKADVSKWKKEAADVTAISAAKDKAIALLRDALGKWEKLAGERETANKEAGKALDTMSKLLTASNNRIRVMEESDRELPDCEALMRIDLAAVCPATAAGMRERATRSLAPRDH